MGCRNGINIKLCDAKIGCRNGINKIDVMPKQGVEMASIKKLKK